MDSPSRKILVAAALSFAVIEAVHAAPAANAMTMPAAGKASRPAQFVADEVPAASIRLPAPDPAAFEALRTRNSHPQAKRLEAGIGREIPSWQLEAAPAHWASAPGGSVARWNVTSEGAQAIRVALRATAWPASAQLRFSGVGEPGVVYGPYPGSQASATGAAYWSPVLEGDTATIEVFVPAGAQVPGLAVDHVSHLFASFADPKAEAGLKVAAACSVDVACRASDAALAETARSVARISFTTSTGGSAFCTGTLLNSSPATQVPYFATAGHCIATPSEAASVSTRWFYQRAGCGGGGLHASDTMVGGGAVLLYGNETEDFSLLQLNGTPPAGAVFSGWDAARLDPGQPVTGVHHPTGDVKMVSLGTAVGVGRSIVANGSGFRIQWGGAATGFTEQGSSGSGIFSGDAGAGYRFRGTLQGGPLVGCASPVSSMYDYYSRFDLAFPFIAQYLNPAAAPALGPNTVVNATFESGAAAWTQSSLSGLPIITSDLSASRSGAGYAWLGGANNANDVLSQTLLIPAGAARLQFWYHIVTQETSTVGRFDRLVLTIADPNTGEVLHELGTLSNLDRTTGYVQSPVYDLSVVGNRTAQLRLRATTDETLPTSFLIDDVTINGTALSAAAAANQTALWFNAAESGWGINVSHQGDTAFATLFTYDFDGSPMWLVMPSGRRQEGAATYSGLLYRTTGPAFNADPFTPLGPGNITEVGDLTLDFNGGTATMGYFYNERYVSKVVSKQVFGAAPATCVGIDFSASPSRPGATNYQDLWWNPAESGWGLNITHQGDTIFATLFTYDANGRGLWLVLPAGVRQGDGSFLGDLYRTTGPAFNAVPFNPIGPGNITQVGTMRLRFTHGELGTLEYSVNGANVTKTIVRQVFDSPVPLCSG